MQMAYIKSNCISHVSNMDRLVTLVGSSFSSTHSGYAEIMTILLVLCIQLAEGK